MPANGPNTNHRIVVTIDQAYRSLHIDAPTLSPDQSLMVLERAAKFYRDSIAAQHVVNAIAMANQAQRRR